ncbi:hypothetical protein K492DRAFT_178536 [Lichtheimia hyalospora FSU 10163]|nr:hypothetical protein K492DRAFT_178536 [Lichtheimia hyalospora FSU 10163]
MGVVDKCHFNALSGTQLSATRVSHNNLPCGYQSSSTCMDALDVLSSCQYLRVYYWSRLGLFVPTLFVMHDVSLTPTRKQLLIW